MLNVAICYWGLTRSTKLVYTTHHEHVFNILKQNNINYKIFMHTWQTDTNIVWNKIYNTPLDYEEYKLLSPDFYKIDNQDDFLKEIIPNFSLYFDQNLYNKNPSLEWEPYLVRNHMCALESLKRVTNMLNEEFTHVIYLRPDVDIFTPFNIDWLSLKPGEIMIPDRDNSEGGFNDRFAIVHYTDCKKYANRIDNIAEYRKNIGRIVSEHYTRYTIEKYFKQVKFITFNFDIIRPQKRVVDCFIFYNELEMLEYRLTVLNDVVDYFVIVEANQTHTGKPKPLFFSENKDKFSKYLNKIIHVVVDLPYVYPSIDYTQNQQWLNEQYQRNCIDIGINKLSLEDCDIIIISDLDEIPNPKILEQIKQGQLKIQTIKTMKQDLYYYNLSTKTYSDWLYAKILTHRFYKQHRKPTNIRNDTPNCELLENAGWHLSYFGDAKFIKNKIENFGHQELNTEKFTDTNNIQNNIKNNRDLYDRNVPLQIIPLSQNTNLPPNHTFFNYLNI